MSEILIFGKPDTFCVSGFSDIYLLQYKLSFVFVLIDLLIFVDLFNQMNV